MKENLKVQLLVKLINFHSSLGRTFDINVLRHWFHPRPRWTYWLWDHMAISICLSSSVGVLGGSLELTFFDLGFLLHSMFHWTGDPTFFDLGIFALDVPLDRWSDFFGLGNFLPSMVPPDRWADFFRLGNFLPSGPVVFFVRHPSKTPKKQPPNMIPT